MKHIFWKHNQEAEHWANLPAEGQRKSVVDRYSNSESWKAVKSFWDASAKDNGKSGCGVVIKGVDRDRWVTISKIAVLLKADTSMSLVIFEEDTAGLGRDTNLGLHQCSKQCLVHLFRMTPSSSLTNHLRASLVPHSKTKQTNTALLSSKMKEGFVLVTTNFSVTVCVSSSWCWSRCVCVLGIARSVS